MNRTSSREGKEPRLRIVVSNAPAQPEPQPAPGAVKGVAPQLDADVSLDDAAAAIVSACLDHFIANWPALRATADPESVHQMRVALRRMRAAIGFLRRALHSEALERASRRAREIATTLGEARDWDVFAQGLEHLRAPLADDASYAALVDAVERRRRAGREKARRLVDAAETTGFVADLKDALLVHDWRLDDDWRAPGSARIFARKALRRLHRHVAERSAGLAELSVADRHQARIALKKLRYAAEFFDPLFGRGGKGRAFAKVVAAAQDALGAENDMAVANRLLRDIAHGAEAAPTIHAAGFVQGWRAHAAEEAAQRLDRIEKSLRRLDPFWT